MTERDWLDDIERALTYDADDSYFVTNLPVDYPDAADALTRLIAEVRRLRWFEENMYPYIGGISFSPDGNQLPSVSYKCTICGALLGPSGNHLDYHSADCEYVAHCRKLAGER